MCDPIVMGAIAVGSAGLQIAQGYAQAEGLEAQADNQRLLAGQQLQAGNLEANQRRAQAERVLGSVRATQSAAGVDLSTGSAADVGGAIAAREEHDALMKLYEGRLGAWQSGYAAQVSKSQAKSAIVGGYASAAQTLLTSAASGGFFDGAGGIPAASSVKKLPLNLPYTPSAYG